MHWHSENIYASFRLGGAKANLTATTAFAFVQKTGTCTEKWMGIPGGNPLDLADVLNCLWIIR